MTVTPPLPSRTAPGTRTPPRRWFLRPAVVLPFVLGLFIAIALLTPEALTGRRGDARLTTHAASSQGARLLYELASRLGWRVERWSESGSLPSDPRTILAVLDPPEPLSALEVRRVLEHVRAGGALLYVMNGRAPLNDSLHVSRSFFGGEYAATEAGSADVQHPAADTSADMVRGSAGPAITEECDDEKPYGGALPMWLDQRVVLYQFEWTRPRPAGTVVFASASLTARGTDSARRSSPAAAGFPFGRGRVVVISDPDLLRNDVLRVCDWKTDVVAVRMLEYLSDAGAVRRDRIVFDEYHQGYGTHPGTFRAIALYLSRAASGHVLLQVIAGGLVLLLALGPRALPPTDTERVERRSPLEHVSALAGAYARVGATRTAAIRLLHGVRRRVEHAGRHTGVRVLDDTDDDFLTAAERTSPALAPDVALVRRALVTPLSRREFTGLGAALRRIESSFLTLGR